MMFQWYDAWLARFSPMLLLSFGSLLVVASRSFARRFVALKTSGKSKVQFPDVPIHGARRAEFSDHTQPDAQSTTESMAFNYLSIVSIIISAPWYAVDPSQY